MKRGTSAKFSKIESAYEAVNEDLKILSQKIEGVKKNMVVESVSKLKHADEKYSRIILTHDMATEDRDEYKRLVAEAKEKQKDEISGEFIFRVKGAPGNFRLLKIRRRY